MKTRLLRIATMIAMAGSFVGIFPMSDHSAQAAFPGANGRIAFQNGIDEEIWVMDSNGQNRDPVTSGGGDRPAWSPDGTEIVYERYNETAMVTRLRIVEVDGPSDDGIPNTDNASEASWAPDGERIIYSHRAAPGAMRDVAVINRNGTGFVNMTLTPNVDEFSPVWSPDGSKIAYIRTFLGETDLWIMDANGANADNLTDTSTVPEEELDWSPESESIIVEYYNQTDGSRIGRVDIDSGAITPLTDGKYDNDPVYSPLGDKIAFHRYLAASPDAVPQGGPPIGILVMDADGENEQLISPPGDPTYDWKASWGFGGEVPLIWGDNDCSGEYDELDALATLVYESETFGDGCPNIGATIPAAGFGDLIWGDLNCSDGYDADDVLLLLRDAADLPPANLQQCPALGVSIAVR